MIDLADLKRKSVRGGAITMVSQGGSLVIQLTSTVVLARLLSPEDYGIIAMVMAITSFAGLFRDLGLSSAAIQKEGLTRAQQSNLFWLNVAMGALLTVLVAAGSPIVAWFYGKPEVLWVTVALSFTFLIGSFGSQHGAMLVRNMQLGRKATAGILGALVSLVTAVILALQGWSYWSLVWGNLSGGLTSTVLLLALSPFRPGRMAKRTGIRGMLKFGANVTGFELVNYLHRNLDNLLIGRFVGADALGFYSRAHSLLKVPITTIRGPINTVGFPALSRLQDQPEDFRAYCRKISWTISFFSMPLAAFLGIMAGRLIPLALGVGWEDSVPLFTILSIVAFIQPPCSIRGQVMLSRGDSRRQLRWGIVGAAFRSIAFVVGISWGALGVAAAYAVAEILLIYPSIKYAFRGSPVEVRDFFGSVFKPAVCSLAAAGGTLGVSGITEAEFQLGNLLHIGVMLAIFAAMYAGLLTAADEEFRRFVKNVKKLASRKP